MKSPEVNEIEWFVGCYEDHFAALTGGVRLGALQQQAAQALAITIISLLDKRLAAQTTAVTNETHIHYHPTSDQVLKAANGVVSIEPVRWTEEKYPLAAGPNVQRINADGSYERRFPGGDGK